MTGLSSFWSRDCAREEFCNFAELLIGMFPLDRNVPSLHLNRARRVVNLVRWRRGCTDLLQGTDLARSDCAAKRKDSISVAGEPSVLNGPTVAENGDQLICLNVPEPSLSDPSSR